MGKREKIVVELDVNILKGLDELVDASGGISTRSSVIGALLSGFLDADKAHGGETVKAIKKIVGLWDDEERRNGRKNGKVEKEVKKE